MIKRKLPIIIKRKLPIIIVLTIACSIWLVFFAVSQAASETALGSIKLVGKPKIGEDRVTLDRKRFFLLRGSLEANKALVDQLKETEVLSRDCYYESQKASPQFMCWLKTEKYNCESPYCRDISFEDINSVPEFKLAYTKGLRQFRNRKELARQWITTNLPATLRDGFYRQQKAALNKIETETKPIQALMTDSILGTAQFIDIPLTLKGEEKKQTFTVSNLLPMEIGNKSFVWVCEVEVGADKQVTLLLPDKKNKNCEVFVKDLKVCKTAQCGGEVAK